MARRGHPEGPVEWTTLRRDVSRHDGRHAELHSTDDWQACQPPRLHDQTSSTPISSPARRRYFRRTSTISLGAGSVHRRSLDASAEDHLRILRSSLPARFGQGAPDAAAAAAAPSAQDRWRLSRDEQGRRMLKLRALPDPPRPSADGGACILALSAARGGWRCDRATGPGWSRTRQQALDIPPPILRRLAAICNARPCGPDAPGTAAGLSTTPAQSAVLDDTASDGQASASSPQWRTMRSRAACLLAALVETSSPRDRARTLAAAPPHSDQRAARSSTGPTPGAQGSALLSALQGGLRTSFPA